jgi:hypothetical protein
VDSYWRAEPAHALQNAILRYSRLEICATSPYLRRWVLSLRDMAGGSVEHRVFGQPIYNV